MLLALAQETVEKGLLTISQSLPYLIVVKGLFYLALHMYHTSCLVFSKSNNIRLNILGQLQKKF